MKKNKKNNKIKEFLNSYKSLVWFSMLINLLLVIILYIIISSNKTYTFSGSDEYLKINDGLITLNNDLNIIYGNNIKYINNIDYDIKSYKIGYYVIDEEEKLIEIISNNIKLDTEIKLSELINNFNSFNVSEKSSKAKYFTRENKKLLNNGLYLVMEAKTTSDETIFSKIKLNISKISKY